jgi:hypothetical protein
MVKFLEHSLRKTLRPNPYEDKIFRLELHITPMLIYMVFVFFRYDDKELSYLLVCDWLHSVGQITSL